MSGDGILLDTNAVIYFLEGRSRIAEHVLLAESIYFSVITEIELLSAAHLTPDESATIREFLGRCRRVELTPDVVDQTIAIRRNERIRTPDAIVAASAIVLDVPLMTADRQFSRISDLKIITDILE